MTISPPHFFPFFFFFLGSDEVKSLFVKHSFLFSDGIVL